MSLLTALGADTVQPTVHLLLLDLTPLPPFPPLLPNPRLQHPQCDVYIQEVQVCTETNQTIVHHVGTRQIHPPNNKDRKSTQAALQSWQLNKNRIWKLYDCFKINKDLELRETPQLQSQRASQTPVQIGLACVYSRHPSLIINNQRTSQTYSKVMEYPQMRLSLNQVCMNPKSDTFKADNGPIHWITEHFLE